MRFEAIRSNQSANRNNILVLYRYKDFWNEINITILDFSNSTALILEQDEFEKRFPHLDIETVKCLDKRGFKGLNREDFVYWKKHLYGKFKNIGFWYVIPAYLKPRWDSGDGMSVLDKPVTCLDHLTRNYEFEIWNEQNYSDMDEDRRSRVDECASYGGIGSTHGEVIEDEENFLDYLDSNRLIASIYVETIREEIEAVRDYHIQQGTIDQVIG